MKTSVKGIASDKRYQRSPKGRATIRNNQLKSMYGITKKEYDILHNNQEGRCAICGKHQIEFKRKLCIDYVKGTKNVRGLLCIRCNAMIAMAKDNPTVLLKAVDYLFKYLQGKHVPTRI